MATFYLGRGDHNHIVKNSLSISTTHLKIIVDEQRNIVIEDQASSGGTCVNGRRIKRFALRPGVTVRLGEEDFTSDELIKDILAVALADKTDYTFEFKKLIPVLKKYEKRMTQIDRQMTVLHRAPSIVALFTSLSMLNMPDKSAWLAGIQLAASALLFVVPTSAITRQKAALKGEYSETLRCPNPKCGRSLMVENPLAYFRTKKTCDNPHCNARYFH